MLDSAIQKLERANHHISDVERQFTAFVSEKPHRFSVQTDPKTGEVHVRVRFLKQPPSILALIIGDAVHNMRVALDHMIWDLVGWDGGTQDRYLKLPTGNTRVNFEASCQGVKTQTQGVKDFIKTLEVFPNGKGDSLYALHLMDNADKHTVLTPVIRATSHPPVTITMPGGGTIQMQGNTFIGGFEEHATLASVPGGSAVELEDDANCPPSIFFSQSANRFPTPVLPTLKQWQAAVDDSLRRTADFMTK